MSVMNTGICKGLVLGLAAMMLSACEEIPVAQKPNDAISKPSNSALMMSGKVTLAAPKGYCIDPESLTQKFALMARCSTMGVKGASGNAPVALITAVFARQGNAPLQAQDIVKASGMETVKTINQDGVDIVRAARKTASGPSSKTHLRSVSTLGKFTLSVSLYAPANSKAQGKHGPQLIRQLVKASRKATEEQTGATTENSEKNGN